MKILSISAEQATPRQVEESAEESAKKRAVLAALVDPFSTTLPTKELAALSRTCRIFHQGFRKILTDRKLDELIRRIVCSEASAAKLILNTNPCFLKEKGGKATDYSGREIKDLTPFQAALCAGDVEMCKMMKQIFLAYPEEAGGQDEMIRQINEIYPTESGGFAGHLERQMQNSFDFSFIMQAFTKAMPSEVKAALEKNGAQFTQAVNARKKSNDNLTLTEALNRFREQFTQKSHSEIVFNPQHFLRAYKVYVAKFEEWDWDKHDLFWSQVIGFMQRFFPACDAQAYAQGIEDLIAGKERFRRSFNFELFDGCFYPIDLTSCSGIGFDEAVWGPEGGPTDASPGISTGVDESLYEWDTKFYQVKSSQLEKLMQDISAVSPAPATQIVPL